MQLRAVEVVSEPAIIAVTELLKINGSGSFLTSDSRASN